MIGWSVRLRNRERPQEAGLAGNCCARLVECAAEATHRAVEETGTGALAAGPTRGEPVHVLSADAVEFGSG